MGMFSDSLYALFEGDIISVHSWLDIKDEGRLIFALRINGQLVDFCKLEPNPSKGNFIYGEIVKADGTKSSVRAEMKMSWIKASCVLMINDRQVPLTASSDAKIKEKITALGHDFQEYYKPTQGIVPESSKNFPKYGSQECREPTATTATTTTTEVPDLPAGLLSEVRAELAKEGKKRKSAHKLVIFIVSLVLFIGAFYVLVGDLQPSVFAVATVAVVIAVLIHETGHLLGMKLFGYRDLSMLFIPFLGAAAGGNRKEHRSTKR